MRAAPTNEREVTDLWLEIAVHDPMVPHENETLKELDREPPDESRREPRERVCLDELVQVDAQQLCRDAEMVPEVEVLRHPDDVVLLVRVLSNVSAHTKESVDWRSEMMSGIVLVGPTHFRRLSRILTSTSA